MAVQSPDGFQIVQFALTWHVDLAVKAVFADIEALESWTVKKPHRQQRKRQRVEHEVPGPAEAAKEGCDAD
ncbi:MAG: hypothetical protein ACKPKO_02075, partial [Candidatus Fonsibacter sp.]